MVSTVEEEIEQHIADMQETFNITREQAESLVEKHDAFMMELGSLPDVKATVIMLLTTTIALASHGGMQPYDFMVLVREVLMQLSQNEKTEWPVAGEA